MVTFKRRVQDFLAVVASPLLFGGDAFFGCLGDVPGRHEAQGWYMIMIDVQN